MGGYVKTKQCQIDAGTAVEPGSPFWDTGQHPICLNLGSMCPLGFHLFIYLFLNSSIPRSNTNQETLITGTGMYVNSVFLFFF